MFAGLLASLSYIKGNTNRLNTQERIVSVDDGPAKPEGYIPSSLQRFGWNTGPPQRPFVKIKLPSPPNPGEQHILIPEIIVTPQYTTAYQLINRSCSVIETPDIKLDPVYTSESNNMDTHSKHILNPNIIDSLLYNQENNGAHHQYIHRLQ